MGETKQLQPKHRNNKAQPSGSSDRPRTSDLCSLWFYRSNRDNRDTEKWGRKKGNRQGILTADFAHERRWKRHEFRICTTNLAKNSDLRPLPSDLCRLSSDLRPLSPSLVL